MGSSSFTLNPSWPHFLGIFLTALGVLVGLARCAFLDWSDPMRCGALLNQGSWLDASLRNWQPSGCMLYPYKAAQAATCLDSKPVVFIGDSVTRKLFFQLAHILDPTLPAAPVNDGSKHSDHHLRAEGGSELRFFWDPYLNSTQTRDLASSARNDTRQPALLVLGSGLWYLRYANASGGLSSWEANMERVLNTITKNLAKPADQVVVLPVPQVVPSKLSQQRVSSMRPSDIDAMNSDLFHRINPSSNFGLPLFTTKPALPVSLPLVFNQMLDPSQTEDGLHFSDAVVGTQANVLLNLLCNDVMPKRFPLDKTCCSKYPWPSLLQFIILALAVSWGPVVFLLSYKPGHRYHFTWTQEVQRPALVFSIGTALVFVADRTGLWLKEQKQFNPWTFGFLCLASLCAGLATVKRSDKDLGFLNRDQTDEWKGWMQIAILIYHYLGASKISGIYNPIRVLVASYLFMTGYGHTTFYLKKADFGFLRVAQVMVRLNLLTLLLAYTMNTDYISYYFSPLVSMWFLIIYATMIAGSRFNDRIPFLLCKILISAGLFTWFMKEGWLLEALFAFLRRVCGIHWSAREWTFRVTLDLWIVYVGMLAAIAVIKSREFRLTEHPHWPLATKVAIGASGICLVWFFAFELLQESKFTYNRWHPYISFLPVLAFVVLRNSSVILRSASSNAFAFVGRCSLETFIIQYHLWLAGDTKGVLVVLPGTQWRPLNFIITTIMFVYVSDQLAQATTTITSWICSTPAKSSLPLPTTAPSNNAALTSSSRREQDVTRSNEDAAVSIPLISSNQQKDNGEDDSLPPEPDTPVRSRRWVERLAEGSAQRSGTPGFRIWYGETEGYGVKTKLAIGVGLMWAANLLWQY
ncbi:putative 10 TM Acyl Transferase domain found in Cas1p [Lyophyllum shimeji]|uniref:10 TM Acyl Transferase domain found in Cas1p n=1 Tax=Lyophyllum shimeji TaxID=47721 RepID=A0A9P3ULW0_LYOSH|nr:putative 10 TM Acyl Transferase domain found in Cas1p [Lyophyllum shimeji]